MTGKINLAPEAFVATQVPVDVPGATLFINPLGFLAQQELHARTVKNGTAVDSVNALALATIRDKDGNSFDEADFKRLNRETAEKIIQAVMVAHGINDGSGDEGAEKK